MAMDFAWWRRLNKRYFNAIQIKKIKGSKDCLLFCVIVSIKNY
jgi:hypothetical protein